MSPLTKKNIWWQGLGFYDVHYTIVTKEDVIRQENQQLCMLPIPAHLL